MLTSRRLVLASAAIVLGLSACGSANTTTGGPTGGSVTATTGAAAGPKVITFGAAGSGATTAASESADKMMAIRNLTYVFDGTLPTLSDTGASWHFPAGFTPDRDRVAAMAGNLGVEGEVRELPADQGGGWMAGPQDYSAATFMVSADGLGSWWFNPAPQPVATVSACEMPAYDPATPVDSGAATDAPATTAALPVCPEPTPPAGVPGEADALSKAKALFVDLGYDASNYDYEFFGDAWSANVTAYLQLDGQRTPVSMTVGFGAEGAVSWASGSLATPVPGDAYPLAPVQTGIDRLNDQAQQWMTVGMGYAGSTMRAEGGARIAADAAATAAAEGAEAGTVSGSVNVVPESAVPAPQDPSVTVDPGLATAPAAQAPAPDMPVQCDPAADCVPVDTTPVTIHLTTVTTDLTMVWDADNTVWLLPAYTFGDADGGRYTVIAVTDEYLHLATPDVVPEPPTTDVVGTDVPADTTPVDSTPVDTAVTQTTAGGEGTDAVALDAASKALVGLGEADATVAAQANGWTLRVVQRDGVDLAVTADFSPSRVNVAVAAGTVVAVQSFG